MQVISEVRLNSLPEGKIFELLTGQDQTLIQMLSPRGLYRVEVQHDANCPIFINSYHRGGGIASCRCNPDLIVRRLEASQGEVSHG